MITLIASATCANGGEPGFSGRGNIDTTGANYLVMVVSRAGGAVIAADSKSNTWNLITSQASGASDTLELYDCVPTTVGTAHTFSALGAGSYSTGAVAAFSGVDVASLYDGSPTKTTNAASTTIQPGSITPSQANHLWITGYGGYLTAAVPAVSGPFTAVALAYASGGYAIGLAWDIQTTATARNPTWTIDSSTNMAIGQVVNAEAEVAEDLAIWELDALTTPALADLLVAVDDPSGTPITKKLALSDVLSTLTLSDVAVQVKTVGSGTYTPTAGMKKVLAIAVGGGGAGAGGVNTDSAGGGGGGGGTCLRLMTAAQIGASKAYVVGAAGAATTLDTAGALLNAGAGAAGTAGAQAGVLGVTAAAGAGGTAANGDLNIPGGAGHVGRTFSGTEGLGGPGGSAVLGFGGAAGGVDVAGGAGTGYGGGGAGGHAAGTPNRDGGAGASGVLYLIEFV